MRKPTRLTAAGVWLGLVVLLGAPGALAEEVLTIRITRSIEAAEPLAVVPFGWSGAGQPPERLAQIVADDLARTGRYVPVPYADLPSRPAHASEVQFSDWRILGAANLVIGRVAEPQPGSYQITFRLYDVFRARQIAGFEFPAVSHGELRRVAHRISDIIYEALTGERGAFDTRIAYVTERRDEDDTRHYSLRIADSDGHNPFTILDSTQPVLSPAWSPDGQRLAYVSYEKREPRIFIQNLSTGERSMVSDFPGLNGAPAWSPDGERLALTLSKDGNPEIYILDLASRRLQRVTLNSSIDTEPVWSPDGSTLAFTSDRSGRAQVYTVDVAGGKPVRLTFEGKYNARPRYSPDGSRLAFVHQREHEFRIAVQDLESGELRVLTETELDESPSFAPNGSMILYATIHNGISTLAAVSTDGRMRQQLGVQKGAVREPAWSPYRRP